MTPAGLLTAPLFFQHHMSVFKVIDNRDLESAAYYVIDLYHAPEIDDLIFIDFKTLVKVHAIIWIPEIIIYFGEDPMEGDQIFPSDETDAHDLEKFEGFILGEFIHVQGAMNEIVKKFSNPSNFVKTERG